MPGILHFARNDPEIAERRTQTRTLVSPPIYANIENLNGGLVYSMSEDGLALSAAMNLHGDGPLGMQIHLPDSRDPVEAKGLVAWRSGSGKTVGIKLVSLSEEARLRIRNWLASENLQSEPRSEEHELPRLEQDPAIGSAKTALFPLPNPMDTSAVEDQTVGFAQIAPDSLVGGDSSAQPGERRAFPRWPIRPFSYVGLGDNNGGVLLNISESGLAVTSAMVLAEKDLPSIVVQFTGSQDQVNVSGQIAWISESKKEAGIRFVNLTEQARRIIAGRISKEQSPAEDQVQSVKSPDPAIHALKPKVARLKIPKPVDFPDGVAIPLETPEIPKLKILKPADIPTGGQAQEDRRASTRTDFSLPDDFVPVATAAVPSELSPKSEFRRKSRPIFRPGTLRAASEQLRRLAAVLVLAAVAGLAIRWVAASPSIRHEVVGFIAENTKSLKKPVELKEALPTSKANKTTDASVLQPERSGSQALEFEPTLTNRAVKGPGAASVPTRPPGRISERSAAKSAVNSTPRRTESPLPPVKSQLAKLPDHAVAVVPNPAPANARSQSVASSPTQPSQSIIPTPAPNLPISVPSGTASAELKAKEPPPPLKQPVVPVSPTWLVSVSTDPYPSIRIPADVSSQKATRGSSLQIGRATSRVEPVYPEEAKRQGVEGTVKLHVVVGRDGTVQSAEPISGPTLLAKAATSAIREWHYAQTLLAGQPVVTEQDIVVNFRLVNPSVAKN
jgi:TonB family protein